MRMKIFNLIKRHKNSTAKRIYFLLLSQKSIYTYDDTHAMYQNIFFFNC